MNIEHNPNAAPADERAAFESLKGAWQSMPPFDVFCAGWQAARAASANETGAEGVEPMAVPAGWKLVRVNEHFDALIAALERAESKGYLPDSMREEWENFAYDENVTASPPPAQAAEPVTEVSGECFIVIGHGETDIPEAKIITRRDDLLDAVLGMMYCPASDAPDDVRAEYAEALADEDGWAADTWSVSFEIGGIVVWHVGLHPFAPQHPAQADAREGLTDEQREAIEYAARWLEENVSNRYAYTAAKQLRALLQGANND
ncbi:hypothetical protein [Burkholderia multivorans]|uniref:hypothetical protein n=1 Tax=Burkholderia multivorans TaxID=87883 RepID=UPI001C226E46|nr:hypothetical protein [Burkholderia multivorans]MBU9604455.1 hypothetical protein [Burkholderia multivorans]